MFIVTKFILSLYIKGVKIYYFWQAAKSGWKEGMEAAWFGWWMMLCKVVVKEETLYELFFAFK